MRLLPTERWRTAGAESTHNSEDHLLCHHGSACVNGTGYCRTRHPRPNRSNANTEQLCDGDTVYHLHRQFPGHINGDPSLHRNDGIVYNAASRTRATPSLVQWTVLWLPIQPLHLQRGPTGNRNRLPDKRHDVREPIRELRAKLRSLGPTSNRTNRRLPSVRIRLPQLASNPTVSALPLPEDTLHRNSAMGGTTLYSNRLTEASKFLRPHRSTTFS